MDDLAGKSCAGGSGTVRITYGGSGGGTGSIATFACIPIPTPAPTPDPTPTPLDGIVHSNGLGGTYIWSAPLGTPGNPGTYTLDMAVAAAASWAPGAPLHVMTCYGAGALSAAAGVFTAIWVFDGPSAGYVAVGVCPIAGDPTWGTLTWN